jgi:DNA-binding transcriptional LysR family regulator
MDTETLYLFAEVMRHRSFTSIAKQRGIAPSSVSRSISALEAEVGVRLFQRTTRQIVPTEAGLLYFERINSVLEELEVAGQLISDVSEQLKGTLRITASNGFGEKKIVPLIIEFNKLYPELSLELLLHDRYTDLVEERIDVAIRVGSLEDSNYIARQLSPMEFYIVASPQYIELNGLPKAPEEINDHSCLIFPRGEYKSSWLFKREHKIQKISITGKHLITQSSATKKCTLAGMGISLLPDWLIQTEIEKGTLVRLFKNYQVSATDFNGAVWMLYPSKNYLPVKVRLFSDFLMAYFTKDK